MRAPITNDLRDLDTAVCYICVILGLEEAGLYGVVCGCVGC